MKSFYWIAGFVILLNLGATCRTPAPLADGCDRLASGLTHCVTDDSTRPG